MLDATSTYEDAKAEYLANAAYAEAGSTAMARAFVTACRHLLLHTPKAMESLGDSIEFEPVRLENAIAAANRWISSRSHGGRRLLSCARFRG